jgi:hypothetical protein
MAAARHFMYLRRRLDQKKVKTMALPRNKDIDPEIILMTRCDMNYACLTDKSLCNAEPFLDRDVQLLRCRDERSCPHKKNYRGFFICTCAVNRASFRIN